MESDRPVNPPPNPALESPAEFVRRGFGLRTKMLAGLAGLLAIVVVVSVLADGVVDHYRRAIDQSYREDYESVAACQAMKETIERLDLSRQATLWGEASDPREFDALRATFEQQLSRQRRDATLPGEPAETERLAALWAQYVSAVSALDASGLTLEQRRRAYLGSVTPAASAVRDAAQRLIDMNLRNLMAVPSRSEAAARRAHWAMRLLTASGVALVLLFAALIGRVILRPVRLITNSVHQIERGNLEQAVPVQASDELGRLAYAFNTMSRKLRDYRQLADERLARTERTTQLAIDSLPDAVLVVNPEANVELTNEAARKLLPLAAGDSVLHAPIPWLKNLWRDPPGMEQSAGLNDYRSTIEIDADGVRRYFLPRSATIRDPAGKPIGATVVLADVTGLRRLDEMKNSLLSLVAHELRTPLTGARMVLHLVVDQKLGPLAPKQLELLAGARDDADRLHRIVENLLDMSRIESGKALMEMRPVPAAELVRRSVQPLADSFAAQDVALHVEAPDDLPQVTADATRIGHVVANLLMNALRYTPAGGTVRVTAEPSDGAVEFSVSDTGCGIPPQYLHRVFEKFFRVPGQPRGSGSGLGLSIAKDIVEAHGGSLRAESPAAGGSRFSFHLPTAPTPVITPKAGTRCETTA